MIKPWTEQELTTLRAAYGTMKTEDLPIDRPYKAIAAKAKSMGLVNEFYRSPWKPEELEFIRVHYGEQSVKEISAHLGRKMQAVYTAAYKMGLTKDGRAHKVRAVKLSEDIVERYLAGETSRSLAVEVGIAWATFVKDLDRRGIERRTLDDVRHTITPKVTAWLRAKAKTGELGRMISARKQGIPLSEWTGHKTSKLELLSCTPEWKAWRRLVYARDHMCCVLCQRYPKRTNDPFDPHHIKRKADFPELTFDVDNGVTLCRACHRTVHGKERQFEAQFMEYVARINTLRGRVS